MKKLRISYNAPVILSFVLVCFIVTILGDVTNGFSTTYLFSISRSSLISPLTYIRLLTHVFGHSGFEHFFGNTMYLLLLGPMLEEKYGSKVMLKVLLSTAVITGLLHCLLWDKYYLYGASGVVFALILLSSFTAVKDGEIPVSFILVAMLYLGREVCNGVLIEDNVSNFTHIIGGIIGSVLGYRTNKKSYRKEIIGRR